MKNCDRLFLLTVLTLYLLSRLCILKFVYLVVCVCVCVRKREIEREREGHMKIYRDRTREIETERKEENTVKKEIVSEKGNLR